MDRAALLEERALLRGQWRRVREERLLLKADLIARGYDPPRLRREARYRALDREQRRLRTLLRHVDIRLDRILAREREKRK